MKKWMLAILLFALVSGETSCVVRVKERRQPYPASQPRTSVVLKEKSAAFS